jgi:hypothetical protein
MKALGLLSIALIFASGCSTTRSISNSAYQDTGWSGGAHGCIVSSPYSYRGELNEFDVLGIDRDTLVSDNEIERALAQAKRVKLQPKSSILLVQSGAAIPDGEMVSMLGQHFRVVPFSGVPERNEGNSTAGHDQRQLSRALRFAAARGGNDIIVCYWGLIESENEKLPGRTISWVPVVNWMTPDQRQHMQVRLKLAVIDVRTGDWTFLGTPPVEARRLSIAPRREVTDQKLVENLKSLAYSAAVKELLNQYGPTERN